MIQLMACAVRQQAITWTNKKSHCIMTRDNRGFRSKKGVFCITPNISVQQFRARAGKMARYACQSTVKNWVIMCILNKLRCWFSIVSAVMSQYTLCPKMKWFWKVIFAFLNTQSMDEQTNGRTEPYQNTSHLKMGVLKWALYGQQNSVNQKT